jgi:hypothetical protein
MLMRNQLASDPVNKCRYADFKSAGTGATISGGWPEPVVLLHSKSPQVSCKSCFYIFEKYCLHILTYKRQKQ